MYIDTADTTEKKDPLPHCNELGNGKNISNKNTRNMTSIIQLRIKEAGGNNRAAAEVLFSLTTAEYESKDYIEAAHIEMDDIDGERGIQILVQGIEEIEYSDNVSLQNSFDTSSAPLA